MFGCARNNKFVHVHVLVHLQIYTNIRHIYSSSLTFRQVFACFDPLKCFCLTYTQENIMMGFAKFWSWLATINTILNLKNKLGLFSILDTSMSISKVLMRTTSRCFHFLKFEDFEWFMTSVMCYNVLIMC